ncbi:MAG: DNA polymerase I [Bdellovibrionales bacterium]
MKKLYLVDVSTMFFRAFFALPPLSNDKGMPTNALYGFLSMTIKLLRDIKPDYIVFCFDTKEPSFRLQIYPEYKANRDEMPEDLIPQIPYVRKISETLGVPILEKPGFEADDLIGTLAKQGEAQGLEVVIVSGDKDFAQLINQKTIMYDTMKEIRYNPEGVMAKWGVKPEQFIDYLALVGDSSDNVPGVRGIGPKGAQKLLNEYKTLDGVYENLDKITGKAMKNNLIEGKDNAYLSRTLVTIKTDVPLDIKIDQMKLSQVNRDHLRELLLELGFKTFAKNLTDLDGATDFKGGEGKPSDERAAEFKPRAVAAKSEKKSPAVAVPAAIGPINETRQSLEELEKFIPAYAEVWGLLDERGFYLGYQQQLLMVDAPAEALGEVLGRKQIQWHGFDLKAVWHYLKIKEPQLVWDSMLAAYVLRAGSIDNFAEVHAHYLNKSLPDLMTPEQFYRSQLEVATVLKEQLAAKNGEKVLAEIELPLEPVLYAMERHGIRLDLEELARQAKGLEADIAVLEKKIFAQAGNTFNIASPKQLAQVLFGQLKLTPGKKTKTGFSTDSDVLEKLKAEHPIAELLLEYRELTKLKSTYVDALPVLIHQDTKCLHTHFNQANTTTGRLSSQNPNLQNIPIRTERGRLVRKAFVAAPGHQLISADYSQIELRILAHITEDEALIRAFADDIDIHAATASEIYGVSLKDVTPDLRRHAKAVNFGIAYGQGAFGLADTLGIGRQEASDIIGRYFNRFKRVRQYMEDIVTTAQKQGYVETIFGRRRYLDELKSKNGAIRKFGERAAINAPMQGTASDLVKLAMIKLHQDLSIPMLLQVHDELLFEAKDGDVEAELPRIRKGMENVAKLKVPLKVNIAVGPNWEDAHA